MITQKLVYYIKKGLARGLSLTELKNALISVGWNPEDIDRAVNIVVGGKQQPVKFPIKNYGLSEQKPRTVLIGAVAVMILVLSVFAGYFLFYRDVNFLNKKPYDCGFDIECFNSLAIKCIPVKLNRESSSSKEYYEIKGWQENLCIWQIKNEVIGIEGRWISWTTVCSLHPDELVLGTRGIIGPPSIAELEERCIGR